MTTLLSGPHPLHVETNGDDRRPALLLINPLGTTIDVWQPMLDELTKHHWVIRFDLRGHGGSLSDLELDYTVEDLVADAVTVLDAMEVPRAHVFGTSLGGLVALTLAATHPDRVDRLIVASTGTQLGPDAWWERTISLAASEGLMPIAEHVEGLFFSEQCREVAHSICDDSKAMLLGVDTRAYVAGARAILAANVAPIVGQIRASTLLIGGENDPVLRYYPIEDLLQAIPDSEAVVVGNTAHRVILEQPVMLASVIEEFLSDPDGR